MTGRSHSAERDGANERTRTSQAFLPGINKLTKSRCVCAVPGSYMPHRNQTILDAK